MKKILVIYVLFAALFCGSCSTDDIKPVKKKLVAGRSGDFLDPSFEDPSNPSNPDKPTP